MSNGQTAAAFWEPRFIAYEAAPGGALDGGQLSSPALCLLWPDNRWSLGAVGSRCPGMPQC